MTAPAALQAALSELLGDAQLNTQTLPRTPPSPSASFPPFTPLPLSSP